MYPTRDLTEEKLFTPGPVMVPAAVREAANHPDIGHRRPQFERILDNVRDNLRELYRAGDDYTAVVVSGSGTAANEAVINSLTTASFLFVQNGEFGQRLVDIGRKHGVEHEVLAYDWGDRPDLAAIESALVDHDIDVVAMPYHETSSAMINPVAEVGALCREYGAYLYADTISAIGGEDVDVANQHIDVATGVANKAVGGLTGCSFVCVREAVLRDLVTTADSVYLDLGKHVRYADDRSQTPNTPAVTAICALDAALYVLLEEETVAGRIERYRRCAGILRDGLSQLDGLSLLLPPSEMANMLTSVVLPERVALDHFIDALDDRGYVVYPGKGPYRDHGVFQVGNMGEIYASDCHELLENIESVLAETG